MTLCGEDETVALGRRAGLSLAPDRAGVIALSGHLGAGKTTFVKGLAESLGLAAARDVVSPTFLRVIRYDGDVPLLHVDAYRMRGPEDVIELGLDEDLAGGAVVAIEWAEIVEGALPADRLTIRLEPRGEDARCASVTAGGPRSSAWLSRILARGPA